MGAGHQKPQQREGDVIYCPPRQKSQAMKAKVHASSISQASGAPGPSVAEDPEVLLCGLHLRIFAELEIKMQNFKTFKLKV